ncbi:MAG: hypothetical protein NTZ68_01935 [Candidatus Dependentiae bacterium]|nr:hypothetical protein [Candidatus Dependentiae bacterium]
MVAEAVDTDLVKWQMFVKAVHAHIDPVLASMLFETDFIKFDQAKKIIHLVTLKKFTMFQDLFIEQRSAYQEYLDRIFGFKSILVVEFIKTTERRRVEEEKRQPVVSGATRPSGSDMGRTVNDRTVNNRTVNNRTVNDRTISDRTVSVSLSKNEKNIDIADETKWKLTHRLLENFGGTVREIVKDSHEFDA